MKDKVINFGCRLNACESEEIEKIVAKFGLSDYVVVNTCAVTAEAERQVKQFVRKLHRENPEIGIILTGCASTYNSSEYEAIDGVVAVIPNDDKLNHDQYAKFAKGDFCQNDEIVLKPIDRQPKVRQFVQIQNGCDNFCTYCIVRQTRGQSVSFSKDEILAQIRQKIDRYELDGPCEIVLTGVNISSYNLNGDKLPELMLFLLDKEPRLKRLRLSSMDPADIDENFIDTFVNTPEIMPHLHMSIQSGDNMILKRMRRRHTREMIIDITKEILSRRPDTIFGSDFITGFPTETSEMFENTKNLLSEANIFLTHIFPYSRRPGTPADLMPQVDVAIRKERTRELIKLSDSLLTDRQKLMIGSTIEVLAEDEYCANGCQKCVGKTANFLPVETSDKMDRGSLYTAKVVSVNNGKLEVKIP